MASLLRLTLALVVASLVPAVAVAAPPMVGQPIDLDPPVIGPLSGGQDPRVASAGSSDIVVWAYAGARAAAISPTGTVPKPLGVLLDANGDTPDVAFGGGKFFAAWESIGSTEVAQLASDGTPMNAMSLGNGGKHPSIAFDGTDFLVVAPGGVFAQNQIVAHYVTPAGVIGAPFFIGQGASGTYPSVGCGNGECLVVWQQQSAIQGAIVSVGSTSAPSIFSIGNGVTPAVGFDGTNFLATWEGNGIQAVRIDTSGAAIGAPLSVASSGLNSAPSVIGSPSGFFVTWLYASSQGNSQDVVGARVNSAGTVVDAAPVLIASGTGSNQGGGLGYDGTHYVASWTNAVTGGANPGGVFARRLDPATAMPVDPMPIRLSWQMNAEADPAVASNPTGYLAVWSDVLGLVNGVDRGVRGVRLDPSGAPLDAASLPIFPAGWPPAVAGVGTGWLVVERHDYIWTAIVSQQGAVTSQQLSIPGPGSGPIGVASNGSVSLLSWKATHSGSPTTIVALRVDASGNALDAAPITVATYQSGLGLAPSVSWDGSAFYVSWSDTNGPGYDNEVMGARIDASGTIVTPAFSLKVTASPYAVNARPITACGAASCLTSYWDAAQGGYMVGQRVVGANPLDPAAFKVLKVQGVPQNSVADWQADHWLVVGYSSSSLSGARVDANGVVLDPVAFAIRSASFGPSVSVASATNDKSLITFTEQGTPSPPVSRARAIVISSMSGTTTSSTSSTTVGASTGTGISSSADASSSSVAGGTTGSTGAGGAGGASSSSGSPGGGSKGGCSCRIGGGGGDSEQLVLASLACAFIVGRRRASRHSYRS